MTRHADLSNSAARLPNDSALDHGAIDVGYAAVSTPAVLGLVAAVAGASAFLAAPLVAVPLAGFLLGLSARRKIARSCGVLTGKRIATAAMVLGGALTLAASAYHAGLGYHRHRTLSTLSARAYAVTDDLLAGRYAEIFEQMPEDFRQRQAAGPEPFRSRFLPLFEGAGDVVRRSLESLQPLRTEEGDLVAPAEMRVELQRRVLELTVWFRRNPAGDWDLVGVGGQETLESLTKFEGQPEIPAVPGPYQRCPSCEHGHPHHH